MNKKIIFLDIDGVLNNFDSYEENREVINEDMVYRLKRIVDSTDAEIIMTASWRIFYNNPEYAELQSDDHFRKLLSAFEKYDMSVSGVTEEISYGSDSRPNEIRKWLSDNPDTKQFVILDDSDWNWKELSDHVVKTRRMDKISANGYRSGLEDEDVETAVRILNKEK